MSLPRIENIANELRLNIKECETIGDDVDCIKKMSTSISNAFLTENPDFDNIFAPLKLFTVFVKYIYNQRQEMIKLIDAETNENIRDFELFVLEQKSSNPDVNAIFNVDISTEVSLLLKIDRTVDNLFKQIAGLLAVGKLDDKIFSTSLNLLLDMLEEKQISTGSSSSSSHADASHYDVHDTIKIIYNMYSKIDNDLKSIFKEKLTKALISFFNSFYVRRTPVSLKGNFMFFTSFISAIKMKLIQDRLNIKKERYTIEIN